LALLQTQNLALMNKGRPIAVLMRVENGDVDDVLQFVRRVRRDPSGTHDMTIEQVRLARLAYRFGKGRHPAGLNLGDCCSYALACER
jgi:uncharacterized protein with PIN domain